MAIPLLAGATGCSSSALSNGGPATAVEQGNASSAVKAPWPEKSPHSGLAKGFVLPLEAYEESYPESVTMQRALNRLEGDCMAGFGFAFSPPRPGEYPPPNYDASNMVRRYGITDPGEAGKFGYHLAHDSGTPPADRPLTAAAEEVLRGIVLRDGHAVPAPATYHGSPIPQNGCVGESEKKLGGPLDMDLPDRLDAASLNTSQGDPRVRRVLDQWSQCMKRSGYRISLPGNAAELARSGERSRADSAEIAIAVADVRCKQQTDLVAVWFDVESALQRQQITQNKSELDQVRARLRTELKTASDLTD